MAQLNALPNMNALLDHARFKDIPRERVKRAASEVLDRLRDDFMSGAAKHLPTIDECAELIFAKIARDDVPNLRGLINATGVVLHTNLGRAPLGEEVHAAVAEVFRGYCNLEYELETGQRGSRHAHVEGLICELTGAQAAMVVNNNAAATVLMLGVLARGKKVAISRGELVEIGGSFRVPEIILESGAELVEVGTTNKTRLRDYADAVSNKGAEVLLKVHTSNFEIKGFTESVSIAQLAEYGAANGLPVLYDMGACFLLESEMLGLQAGETARDAIADGADVICFSGDKLVGAVQTGIIAGRADMIEAMKKHPLARAVRPDKLTLAVLETVLRLYRDPGEARRRVPTLAMLSIEPEELRRRAQELAEALGTVCGGWDVEVCETTDETGGGALPNVPLPGWAVALRPQGTQSVTELEQKLRRGHEPVIIRIHNGAALISPRTLLHGQGERVADAFRRIFAEEGQG